MVTEQFGEIIREARYRRGLTQAEAAALCGVGERSWRRWEAGGQPRMYEARMILEKLAKGGERT